MRWSLFTFQVKQSLFQIQLVSKIYLENNKVSIDMKTNLIQQETNHILKELQQHSLFEYVKYQDLSKPELFISNIPIAYFQFSCKSEFLKIFFEFDCFKLKIVIIIGNWVSKDQSFKFLKSFIFLQNGLKVMKLLVKKSLVIL